MRTKIDCFPDMAQKNTNFSILEFSVKNFNFGIGITIEVTLQQKFLLPSSAKKRNSFFSKNYIHIRCAESAI